MSVFVRPNTRGWGSENRETRNVMSEMAGLYKLEGKFAEAENLLRKIYEIELRLLGAEDADTLDDFGNLAILYAYKKQYERGKGMMDQAVSICKSKNPDELGETWFNYACFEGVSRHSEKSFEYLRNALDLTVKDLVKMDTDDGLVSLRGDPRFAALIAEARKCAGLNTPPKH